MNFHLLISFFVFIYISNSFVEGQGSSNVCNTTASVQCLANQADESWIEEIISGNLTVLSALDIDYVCSSLQDVYICIDSYLDGCAPGLKLAYYTAITAARYLCNEGRQGYISNAQCLMDPSVLPVLQSCTTLLINNFPASSENLTDDKGEICGLFSDWANCMVRPVLDTCNSAAVTYMKTLLNKTLYPQWHKNWVPCTIEITAKPPVITTESSTTNVSTNGSAECDVQGATHCLSTVKPTYQPVLMMLATQNLINITAEKVQSICMYLQDAYRCVGTKLDRCSDGVHLLRDVILSGSRYICNENSGAFLDSIGCLAKLKAASTTINCLRSGPFLHSDIHKYFTGEKDVFSNKEEFCRISSNWTTCYMESVSSLCSQQEYDFVFQYVTHTYNPLKTALQCDIFSEIAQPEYTPTAAPEPTNEPIPTAEITEPEPTPAVTHEQTSKTTKTTPVITSVTSNSPRRECTCYNGGTCIQHSNGFTCKCPPKMFGTRCELGVGGCPGYPCFNGGSCQANDNGPRCLCPAGFPGLHCEGNSPRRECTCYNGGTCIQHSNGFTCKCPPKMFGTRCELGVGGCPGYPCFNGGSCQANDNGPRCLCPAGFPGLHCEEIAQPEYTPTAAPEPTAEPIPTAESTQPEPTPDVTPEPTNEPEPTPYVTPEPTNEPEPTPYVTPEPTNEPEPTPDVTPDPTNEPEPTPDVTPEPTNEPEPTPDVTPEPTNEPEPTPDVTPEPTNEPEPTPDVTPEPTNEPIPTAEITEPEPTPAVTHEQTSKTTKTTPVITSVTSNSPRRECTCYNGGTCIQHSNGFTCKCPPKMFGTRCELGVGGCPGYPCFNGGSCQANDNGPRCLCPAGFPGLHCEGNSPRRECTCYNGGTCIQHSNGVTCKCPPKMFGTRCEMGVGGCPGYPCFNGGSCQANDNGPRCLCPAGFPGLHCEAVGACVSYVCWNGGICHTQTISNVEEAFCSCQHGFIGKFCETNLLWVTVRPTNGTDSDGNSTVTETPETTDVESTTPMTSPTTDNPVSTSPANPFTPTVSLQPKNCRYVGFRTSRGRRRRFNRWCSWNCNRGYCPPSLCRCDSETTNSIMCYPIGIFRRMVGMSGWCNNNCKRQYCPRNMCKCK